MDKITREDKHFWKIVALFLFIGNLVLISVLLGVLVENKIIDTNSLSAIMEEYQIQDLQNNSIIGNKNASLSIVLYNDFECPFSKKFHNKIYENLKKDYIDNGKVNVVLKHLPDKVHKNAIIEAQAFECARDQKKEDEIYHALYQEKMLTTTDLLYIAQNHNLSVTEFEECLYYEKYKDKILLDIEVAKEEGIEKTPTIVINDTKIEGVKPYFLIRQIINEKLQERN